MHFSASGFLVGWPRHFWCRLKSPLGLIIWSGLSRAPRGGFQKGFRLVCRPKALGLGQSPAHEGGASEPICPLENLRGFRHLAAPFLHFLLI